MFCPPQDPSKRKSKKTKAGKTRSKKATSKSHLKVKAKDAESEEVQNELADHVMWKGFNLSTLGIPNEAWPSADKQNKGRQGYTVTATNGAVASQC